VVELGTTLYRVGTVYCMDWYYQC